MTSRLHVALGFCLLLVLGGFLALRQPPEPALGVGGLNKKARQDEAQAAEAAPLARIGEFQKTNAALRQLSTNNPAFQKWGREFMLKAANDHLARVPLFGLKKGALREEDVITYSFLTLDGADLEIYTKDLTHRLSFQGGSIRIASALKDDMTGLFRDPSKLGRFGDNAGSWTDEEAKRAAEALVAGKGLDLSASGAVRGPVVHPEAFDLPAAGGGVQPVTAFYSVAWLDRDGDDVVAMRFRRTESGTWEPTDWEDYTRDGLRNPATSYTNLYRRFFAQH